jgi:hypothetical protein
MLVSDQPITRQNVMADTLVRRLIGAAMLDVGIYEELEADRGATAQALAIVVVSSLAAGIGARGSSGGAATLAFFAGASAIAMTTWAAFALLTFEVGARILPTSDTHGDVGELLRTLGFAATPGLIQVLGVFPGARFRRSRWRSCGRSPRAWWPCDRHSTTTAPGVPSPCADLACCS